MNNPVLYLHVESNKNKGGGGFGSGYLNRTLEEEAIRCVKSWRKYGGLYKDIPIAAVCVTKNPPSMGTVIKLNQLGVTYIESPIEGTDKHPAGWWATPLGGRLLEECSDHDFIIHVDLDMMLLRELDVETVAIRNGNIAKCAVYSDGFEDDKDIDPRWKKTFVTCFITSWTECKFYTLWHKKMMELDSIWRKRFQKEIEGTKKWSRDDWWDYCNLEEHAVDCLYYEDELPIEKIEKVQMGLGYEGVGDLTDEELRSVCFFHNHHDDVEDYEKTLKEYARRRMKLYDKRKF